MELPEHDVKDLLWLLAEIHMLGEHTRPRNNAELEAALKLAVSEGLLIPEIDPPNRGALYVPPAIRRSSAALGTAGDAPVRFSDAQPFLYSENARDGEAQDIAARGVTGADDAECFANYERNMDMCTVLRTAMGGQRFMDACSQRAFLNYQRCRGY